MQTKEKDTGTRRRSDPGTVSCKAANEKMSVITDLPWGVSKVVGSCLLDPHQSSGIFATHSILLDLFNLLEKKLQLAVEDGSMEKLLNKTLQRGEDAQFDNLCSTIGEISELCLPAVLQSVMDWQEAKELQLNEAIALNNEDKPMHVKMLLATNYLFCLVLITILPKVEFHLSTTENLLRNLLDLLFKKIQYKDPSALGVNQTNSALVLETYAEVIGVLAETHFQNIHKMFNTFLAEYKKESAGSTQIVTLVMCMKYVRIKTNQVDCFETGIKFLDDLATFFIDVKDKDIKHAVANVLFEMLVPVTVQIKREANIPALISFVTRLYPVLSEMASKKTNKLAIYPLQTCLLCVSQRQFFQSNWVSFLHVMLANLKVRDTKVTRVALESIFRLIWVYMVRNNTDGNSAMRTRLESVCGSLFPRGSRNIVPRDAPLNIFVKIVHFIAQHKLDFAFKDVIFELLCCNRTQRTLYPERMNIGIRALMVIANGLQMKEHNAVPHNTADRLLPSGTIQRAKKTTYISTPLTADMAKSIGLEQYYIPCRKAFDSILKVLDMQAGKPLMKTALQGKGKDREEIMSGDMKPKLDLFRTCVAAIPRLLPEPMAHTELIEMLSRLTLHVDEELRKIAACALDRICVEFPQWRDQVLLSSLTLLQTQISDFYPEILEESLHVLLQLVSTCKVRAIAESKSEETKVEESDIETYSTASTANCKSSQAASIHSIHSVANVIHAIEGFALIMLCQARAVPRKIAVSLLRETKLLIQALPEEHFDTPMLTVLNEAVRYVVDKYIEHVSIAERLTWSDDFEKVLEKITSLETDNCLVNSDKGNEYFCWDAWACALSGFTERKHLLSRCPTAIAYCWPTLFAKLNSVISFVDPNSPQNESRASLLRASKSKASSVCGEALTHDACLQLWQKYLLLCCALAPCANNHTSLSRSFSPTCSLETDVLRSVSLRASRIPPASVAQLISKARDMLRWENMTDIRDSVVLGVGSMSPFLFESFLEELNQRGVLREAQEKKLETNVRRRKRKELLRLQILRIIEMAVFRGLLDASMIDGNGTLNPLLLDFIDAMRVNLESDTDRDISLVTNQRLHFCKLIVLIIDSVPVQNRANLIPDDRKSKLFVMFTSWCSRAIASDKKHREQDYGSYVEQKAVLAFCRLLCCGPMFDAAKMIGEDGYLYGWLEQLVSSTNALVQDEVEEVLATIVELNESYATNILDWLITQCYTQPPAVSARCFRSLVRVLSRRDLPCEFVSVFVLCQAMCASSATVHVAVHLIELVRKHFLDSVASMGSPLNESINSPLRVQMRNKTSASLAQIQLDTVPFAIEQQSLCRQLAKLYPQLSITVVSEVTCRLEKASSSCASSLLSVLIPWINNLELIDAVAGDETWEGSRGWGSEEATHLLLNNLLWLTVNLSDEHHSKLPLIWKTLAMAFPANLPVILNYLYVMTLLSNHLLLEPLKQVVVMLADTGNNRLASLLLEQLTSMDSPRLTLERSEIPPYYRWKDENLDHGKYSNEQIEAHESLAEALLESSQEGLRLLPMPAYGGHYCALCSHLPQSTQPIHFMSRSQVALLFLCDVVRVPSAVDWSEATPRLLHAAILHLDSLRPMLVRHARQLIINLCLLYVDKSCFPMIANILLRNQLVCAKDADEGARSEQRGESPTFAHVAGGEYRNMLLHSTALFSSQTDLIKAIVWVMSERMDSPLYANEDVTPKCWKVGSAQTLSNLIGHLAELLLPSLPLLPLVWTQLALRMALATTQRHDAGRCFQIVSALCQPPNSWIASLTSRLVETAGESHEDTQAYVTDLLLCLMSSVPHLNPIVEIAQQAAATPTHMRSISYTPALLRQSVINQRFHRDRKDARLSLLAAEEQSSWATATMTRSKSADQLKTDAEADEEANARMQICAIALALLESGLDNEFLLALHLLDKILDTIGAHKLQCLQKVEKTISQLDWKGFSGIIPLVARGCVVSGAYEPCLAVLVRLMDVVDEAVVGGISCLGVAVTQVLPHMLLNFDAPTPLCLAFSSALVQYCARKLARTEGAVADHPFQLIATMMTQYSNGSFTKDRMQWTKCVLQYVLDAIPNTNVGMMVSLLAEMLNRDWTHSMHAYFLHMLSLLIASQNTPPNNVLLNAQVIRSISRHFTTNNWTHSAKILKSIVENWQDTNGSATENAADLVLDVSSLNCKGAQWSKTNDAATMLANTTKRQYPHQKVRDRLVALLSASGLRVGLPSAQSVVFSRSELGSTASSTERVCPSSQEIASTTSLPDPSASITDSFPRVFKEFDFLEAEHDSVSETAESCFGWLSTMRPQSCSQFDERDDDDESSRSEPGDTSRLSRGSTDRTPCASDAEDMAADYVDEELDDEAFGEALQKSMSLSRSRELVPTTTEATDTPRSASSRELAERRSSRENAVLEEEASVDDSSICSRSQMSLDYLPARVAPVMVQCCQHLDGRTNMDSLWLKTIGEVSEDVDGETTAYALLLFTQLYRSCCGRVAALLRDASHAVTSRSLGRALSNAHSVLERYCDLPFLFVTAQFVRSCGVLQRLKLSLSESHEHYETYEERRSQAAKVLNSVKAAQKLSSLGGSTSSIPTTSTETELGKLLNKVFFQLMQMADSFGDMFRSVDGCNGAQSFSLSPAVLDHERELLASIGDVSFANEQCKNDVSADTLVLHMANKRYQQALLAVRLLRQRFGLEFGCCESSDIEVCLLLFCRSHSLKAWALLGSSQQRIVLQQESLREVNADLAAVVRRLSTF